MRTLSLLIGLAVAGSAVPALAQHMNAADSPCRSIAQTYALVTCLDAAEKKSDGQLNQVYRALRAKADAGDRARLEALERAWIGYRDAFCDAEYQSYGGGTGGPPARLACLEALTRHHISELQTAFDWRATK